MANSNTYWSQKGTNQESVHPKIDMKKYQQLMQRPRDVPLVCVPSLPLCITTPMVLAFTAGVMIGSTGPMLVNMVCT